MVSKQSLIKLQLKISMFLVILNVLDTAITIQGINRFGLNYEGNLAMKNLIIAYGMTTFTILKIFSLPLSLLPVLFLSTRIPFRENKLWIIISSSALFLLVICYAFAVMTGVLAII